MAKRRANPADDDTCDLWFELPFGPNVWRIYTADPDTCVHLVGCEGVTVHRASSIYIDRTLERSRMVSVLGHELVHIPFSHCDTHASAAIFGCGKDDESTSAAEERVCCRVGPDLIAALQRSGMLRLPRLPR
jgi:hypothetical protein